MGPGGGRPRGGFGLGRLSTGGRGRGGGGGRAFRHRDFQALFVIGQGRGFGDRHRLCVLVGGRVFGLRIFFHFHLRRGCRFGTVRSGWWLNGRGARRDAHALRGQRAFGCGDDAAVGSEFEAGVGGGRRQQGSGWRESDKIGCGGGGHRLSQFDGRV
ncbi:hypothetical protein PARPLA_03241 [Rhodobacteraceae bacterium THAF1]|nr:hypothetical protein PARPLA_03241 [Rhodobacteraceae bacterium THAF1]